MVIPAFNRQWLCINCGRRFLDHYDPDNPDGNVAVFDVGEKICPFCKQASVKGPLIIIKKGPYISRKVRKKF